MTRGIPEHHEVLVLIMTGQSSVTSVDLSPLIINAPIEAVSS